ncbi:MAG: hypothetical protein ACR2KV_12265 [Solirubrobacteraceae bacterium]
MDEPAATQGVFASYVPRAVMRRLVSDPDGRVETIDGTFPG